MPTFDQTWSRFGMDVGSQRDNEDVCRVLTTFSAGNPGFRINSDHPILNKPNARLVQLAIRRADRRWSLSTKHHIEFAEAKDETVRRVD